MKRSDLSATEMSQESCISSCREASGMEQSQEQWGMQKKVQELSRFHRQQQQQQNTHLEEQFKDDHGEEQDPKQDSEGQEQNPSRNLHCCHDHHHQHDESGSNLKPKKEVEHASASIQGYPQANLSSSFCYPSTAIVPAQVQYQASCTNHEGYQYPFPAQKLYPAGLATHAEVLASRDVFYRTFQSLHIELRTKLATPKIGGKDLDLHLLYKEVTARGGLEAVIRERKWKEITLKFNFPPTTTSASFVLRKTYINLLHHYEQVYFFRRMGQLVPPPVSMQVLCSMPQQFSDAESLPSPISSSQASQVDLHKRKLDTSEALGVDPASSIGTIVTGYIDGKFDHGYLINVMVGTRKMRGVMYHVPSLNARPQSATVSALMDCSVSDIKGAFTNYTVGGRRMKKVICRKDPNAPRQNKTGYNFFFAEQRAKLKSGKPDKDRAISKMIGELWNKLSNEEKLPYQERGIKEKERYRREMSEYKERLRLQSQSEERPESQSLSSKLQIQTGVNLSETGCQQDPDLGGKQEISGVRADAFNQRSDGYLIKRDMEGNTYPFRGISETSNSEKGLAPKAEPSDSFTYVRV